MSAERLSHIRLKASHIAIRSLTGDYSITEAVRLQYRLLTTSLRSVSLRCPLFLSAKKNYEICVSASAIKSVAAEAEPVPASGLYAGVLSPACGL